MTVPEPAPPSLVLAPGASTEAAALLELWDARWSGVDTWRHSPREARPDDWVRFHTLPDGRQTVRHRRDGRTVVRRFRGIVRSVEQLTGQPGMVLLVEDPPWPGVVRDRVLSVVPPLRPWVTHVLDESDEGDDDELLEWASATGTGWFDVDVDADADADEHEIDEAEDEDYTDCPLPSHSFRRGPVDDRLLADLVLLVHEYDGTDFLLLPDDLSWAVGVYDGGIDAVLRNEEEAAALARRFQKWLPPSGWPGLAGRRRPATQRERHRGFGN